MKQTILGAGGSIGIELAKALTNYTDDIRLVSRNPIKVNSTDELFVADILNKEELKKAIEGSEIVYLTVGFEYRIKVWRKSWIKLMSNLIDIAAKLDIKVVFFDNIYLYSQNAMGNITEKSVVNPPSKKGILRAEVSRMFVDAMKAGKIKGLIARSADFYGPSLKNSMLTETVINPLSQGKTANWMGELDCPHSFTYTPDAGKATALLGNFDSAYGQVWHLPTAPNPLTGKQWIDEFAKALGKKAKYRKVTKGLINVMGVFKPVMKEIPEMLYQYDRPYIFNSSKFEKAFNFKTTSYEDGIKQIVELDYSK